MSPVANWPDIIVECAFSTAPLSSSPSWTDISAYARAITIRRGRDFELARNPTGTASILLDNRDRRFDPTYASSPYYPYVIPGRRIRVRAGDTPTSLYDGFVESWPQEWAPPHEARAPLEAADGFKLLNLANLPGGYPQLVLSHSPVGYWRLGETSGTTAEDSSTTGNDATYAGGYTQNVAGALTGDSEGAVTFNGTTGYVSIPNNAAYAVTSQLSLEGWFKTSDAHASGAPLIDRRTNPGNIGGYILWFVTGDPQFYVYTTGWNLVGYTATLNDNAWHHVVGTYNGANMRLYVDGSLVGTTALTGAINAPASPQTQIGGFLLSSNYFNGSIDEVAIYATALSAAQVAAHYYAGRGTFPSQTSMERYTAVLDSVGWPSALRTTHGGLESVQATTLSSATSSLQHLQDVADTEAGRLFIDASGRVRFDGRDAFFLTPYTDSMGSFSDNPLSLEELGYYDLRTKYDDAQLWNDVRYTRTGGSEQIANDTTSISTYGLRTLRQTGLLSTSDTNVLSLAQYRRTQYKDPVLRFTLLTIRPGNDADLWEQVIERDIGDRVRVGRTPQGIGPSIAFDCWIEGVEHDIRPGFWETRWKLSRADAQSYWILDDATYGLLGSTTYLAF